jgi:hypothetical protein
MLPHYAVVDTAKEADAKRAWQVCAWLRKGEIVVFDRAYLADDHLYDLTGHGIFWVTRARWEIEVVFKELKQTLKLVDFIGYSKNTVEWQIWTGLLVYLLMRFMAHLSQWGHSFTRLFSLLRAALWHTYGINSFLGSYGTANAQKKKQGAKCEENAQDKINP